jgi:integrase
MRLSLDGLVKRKPSGTYYLRVATPADLLQLAKGRLVKLPCGDGFQEIKIDQATTMSLRTKDEAVALERFIRAKAALVAFWEALRNGPKGLSHKQVLALAGEVRKGWVEAFDDEPGMPVIWKQALHANLAARVGRLHPLKIGSEEQIQRDMEARFGPLADGILASKTIVTTNQSRLQLIRQIALALDEAMVVNWAKAEGDYSDNGGSSKYPAFEVQKAAPASTEPASSTTFTDIIDRREKEQAAGKDAKPLPAATLRKFRLQVGRFVSFRRSGEVATVTPEEIEAWKQSMLSAAEISNRTIGQHIQNLGTVIEWARAKSLGNLFPASNPASIIERPQYREAPSDLHAFTRAEAKTILKAARSEVLSERRWVPWLCAFSGARVNEIAQLTPDSFFQVEGFWFYRITTLGGKSLKNRHSERRVPVHPALLDEGLIQFVQASTKGGDVRLFPRRTQGNIAAWVNDDLKLKRDHLQPNHGWRHLFQDKAEGSGMEDSAVSYITGRTRGKSGEKYGKSEELLPGLARAMASIPPYL